MIASVNNQAVSLPDCLIVGAAKSGTTSLMNYLQQHSQVFIPIKEPNFFSFYGNTYEQMPSLIRDKAYFTLDKYLKLYIASPAGATIIDASVSYLTKYDTSIKNILALYKEKAKDLQIIIILRNPIDRAFSHYVMFKRNGIENLSFEQAIQPEITQERMHLNPGFNYLENSLYYPRVKAYLEAFPKVQIFWTEEFKRSDLILNQTLSLLNLPRENSIDTKTRFNQGGIPKNQLLHKLLNQRSGIKRWIKGWIPKKWEYSLLKLRSELVDKNVEEVKLDPALRLRLLNEYFSDDIKALEKLLNKDLSAWKA